MSNKFSPSEAAISVFQFMKLQPKFTLQFCVANAIFGLISMAIMPFTGYAEYTRLTNIAQKNPENIQLALDAFNAINLPIFLAFMVISLIFSIAILGASLRKTILSKEIGFYGFNWGNDEWQLFKASMIIGLAYVALVIVGFLAMTIMSFVPVIGLVSSSVGFILLIVWFFARVSQFGVLTVANGKFNFKDTLDFTKNNYWNYIGAYTLSLVVLLIATIIIQFVLNLILGFSAFSAAMSDDANAYAILFGTMSVKTIIYGIVTGAWGGIIQLGLVCVGAYAYHQILANNNNQ